MQNCFINAYPTTNMFMQRKIRHLCRDKKTKHACKFICGYIFSYFKTNYKS